MICSFTIRFRNFIWFLIFTFTLYCMPHIELLLPYELHLSFPEAEASASETEESQSLATQGEAPAGTSAPEQPSSGEAPAQATAANQPDYFQSSGVPSAAFKVDDFTGAAHLSYPVAVPPGRSGLSPNLSLSYNSSAGNGWIGVGWDIPTGYIQRRGPRKGVPKYNDTQDVYELNLGGSVQELVPIGGDEYRLKIEGSFLKIQYNSTNNSWVLWDKSGTKMTFGSTAASQFFKGWDSAKSSTYRWCLDRVEDPKTNYMELIYFKDAAQGGIPTYQIYLQEVRYNAQASGGLPHNHRVLFNLETSVRPDPVYNYRSGFKMWTRYRLSSIEVRTNDNLVRKYQLQYAVPNVRSVLSSITLYGSDGTSTLPPTQFTYQTHAMGFEDQATPWPNPSGNLNFIRNTNTKGTYTDVIDLNGDALPDRVVYDQTSPYNAWTVYYNNGNGFDPGVDWSNPSAWDSINGNYIRNRNTLGHGIYTDVIDLNGDALPDRAVYDKTSPYNTWTVYFNTNGSGFGVGADWSNPSAWSSINGNYISNTTTTGTGTYTDVIDMNGDGLPDRVVYSKTCAPPYATNCPWTIYFNNGTGFGAGVNWSNPSPWDSVNGNYIRNTDTYGTYTDVIDMNGDGLPDRVVFDRTGPYNTWTVYFNNGNGFDPGVDWPNPSAWSASGGNYIRSLNAMMVQADVIDMNGDGLPDRVVYDSTDPYDTWTVYFNNGSGFGPGVAWHCPNVTWTQWGGPTYISEADGSAIYTAVMDMNGDGLPDRVIADKTTPYNEWSVYRNNGPVADLLKKVENGIGGSTEITYAPSTIYTNTFLPFVVQTVSSMSLAGNPWNG